MLRDQAVLSLPPGFRRASAASGLLVPEETPRQREVWTKDEGRLLDRAIALVQSRGMQFMLRCGDEQCKGSKIERIKGDGRDYLLRCPHKDRVFTRAF